MNATPRRVLDAGAGAVGNVRLHPIFADWSSVRLDIDAAVRPDVLGSITDLRSKVQSSSFDAVWSSHNIEHLQAHEVQPALSEMKRILKPDGFAFITCPDLEQIGHLIVGGDVDRTVYKSPAGPISVIDMLYGHSASIARGNAFMCHHTGFTVARLGAALQKAGFTETWVAAGKSIDLWAMALMPRADKSALKALLMRTEQRFLAGH
jgi:SAM-dependent methyltransferase